MTTWAIGGVEVHEVAGNHCDGDRVYELRVKHEAVRAGGWFRFPSALQIFMAAVVMVNDRRKGQGGILYQAFQAMHDVDERGGTLEEVAAAGWSAQRGRTPARLRELEVRT